MTSRKPPKLAAALLRHLTADDGSLVGDLEEGFKSGKTSLWYWSQVLGIVLTNCIQTHTCAISLVLAAVVVSAGSTVGWWQTRFAVPVLLGMAITSWKLWRLHRTSLVILYVASVALVSPYWLSADTRSMTAANQVFWTITRPVSHPASRQVRSAVGSASSHLRDAVMVWQPPGLQPQFTSWQTRQ
jgi:hypothetical protein